MKLFLVLPSIQEKSAMKSKPSVTLKRYFLASFFFVAILFGSCGRSSIYDHSLEIGEIGWHQDSLMIFDDVIITDTISPFDFYINLRHTTDYRYSNFYLFLNTTMPNGNMTRDTIELVLADNYGKWYGNGFGHIKDNRILVRENLVFPLKGNYHFSIEQAMREDDKVLENIRNVGFRIE